MLLILIAISLMPSLTMQSFVKQMGPQRAAKNRLYNHLASVDTVKHKLSPESSTGIVHVDYSFWLTKVSEIVETDQTFTAWTTFSLEWEDKNLSWKEEEFYNLSKTSPSFDLIWNPSLFIMNSAVGGLKNVIDKGFLTLHSNGLVHLRGSAYSVTHCNFQLIEYPFDHQTCQIYFSLIGGDVHLNPRKEIPMDPSLGVLSKLVEIDGEWTITNQFTQVQISVTGDLIMVEVKVQRASLFYTLCFLLPMIATSLLTLFVFWIPPGSGEKMSYLISIFLSTSLYINLVSDNLPRNFTGREIPRITRFLICLVVECVLAIICTIFVMGRYQEEQRLAIENGTEDKDSGVTFSSIQNFFFKTPNTRPASEKDALEETEGELSCWSKLCPKRSTAVHPFQEKAKGNEKRKLSAKALDKMCFFVLLLMLTFCSFFAFYS